MPVTIDGSNTPTAGGVGYGDGTELAFTTAGTAGQVLQSNGAGAPTWAAVPTVNLATGVTGTLPVGNGGTGTTTLTANNVLLGNGTSALQTVAPGSSGNVLTSDGTTWTSSTPAGGGSLILVTTTTGSSVSSAALTSGLNATYPVYKLYVNYTNIGSNRDLAIRYYIAGSLQTSPSGYYRSSMYASPGSNWTNSSFSGSASIYFAALSGQNVSLEFTIFTPASTTRPPVYFVASNGVSTANNGYSEYGMFGYDMSSGAGALTGFEFSFSGSSVNNFSARLYGIKT
jgi:hypothetical protein